MNNTQLSFVIFMIFLIIVFTIWSITNKNNMIDNFTDKIIADTPNNETNKVNDTNGVEYKVTFSSTWGANSNINSPTNPHTGVMFLITHNDMFSLFDVGDMATRGISTTSMFGTVDDLMLLVEHGDNVNNIKEVVTDKVLSTPGNQSMTIKTSSKFPNISFCTMIAPSPDWFTGVSGVNLMQPNGKWIDNLNIPLYVYDAGTDSGIRFDEDNHYVRPLAMPITLKTDRYLYNSEEISPIAYLKISRV